MRSKFCMLIISSSFELSDSSRPHSGQDWASLGLPTMHHLTRGIHILTFLAPRRSKRV